MSDMRTNIIQDTKALAFPTIIGIFAIFIGLALFLVMNEVITPIQSVYANTSYIVGTNSSSGAITYYNATVDPYAGYLNSGWSILPVILLLIGAIYLMVQSNKE